MMMTERLSKAAQERAEAQKALAKGELHDRDSYSAKQIAFRCGTDAKTMRKFFRSSHSTVEPVGQGGRYEFDARDLPKIQREFRQWSGRASIKNRSTPTPKQKSPTKLDPEVEVRKLKEVLSEHVKSRHLVESEDEEPTEEELMEIEDLDLDDLGDD